MRSALSRLLAILLLLSPAIVLGQGKEKTKGQAEAPAQQTSDQTKTTATKHGKARKKDGQSSNRVYEALTIPELVGEDPNASCRGRLCHSSQQRKERRHRHPHL